MLYQHRVIVRIDSFRLIMYTIYRSFDLDYHVYVVRDNCAGLTIRLRRSPMSCWICF